MNKKLAMVTAGAAICLSAFLPVNVKADDTVELYRLYNLTSGEHFYTLNTAERDNLKNAGWVDEGTLGTVPTTSNTPVYRAYNPVAGDHIFTIDQNEIANAVANGWRDEGIAFYSDDNHTIEIKREYNPNAYTGTHNYTGDGKEDTALTRIGWLGEGTHFYVSGAGRANPNYAADYAAAKAKLTPPAPAPAQNVVHGSDIVGTAMYWVGRGRYAMGGSDPATGVDCAKFTQYVYAQHGIQIAGTAAEQAASGTPTNNPQPGDLVLWTSHASIYIGNGQIVAATNPRQGIKVSNVSSVMTPGSFMGYYHVNGVNA